MLANLPPVRRRLDALADRVHSAPTAISRDPGVARGKSDQFGAGLVIGALFAKALPRRVRVDYRLLVASADSGFVVCHGRLAGPIALTIATLGQFVVDQIGVIPTTQTIFAIFNLVIVGALFIAVPMFNRFRLRPTARRSRSTHASSESPTRRLMTDHGWPSAWKPARSPAGSSARRRSPI